jgi:sigma-B regulation protein RsbU (phosphoserine phosphatase)
VGLLNYPIREVSQRLPARRVRRSVVGADEAQEMESVVSEDARLSLDAVSPAATDDAACSQAAPCARPARSGKHSVLVVDDDPDSLRLVERLLTRAGYDVTTALDGATALERLQAQPATICLLDCEMPGMSGFEVCERLKRDPQLAEMPVVFLTALSEPDDVARAFEIGGTDYVRKPVAATELLARVRAQVELVTSRAALQRRASLLESIAADGVDRLELVRSGQLSLLTPPEQFPELKLAIQFRSADVAGGDFYEVVRFSDSEYGLLVADVAGHDLTIPFITGALKALSATLLNAGLDPDESMSLFNAGLKKILLPGCYVTACCARYALERNTLQVTSAGHPPALYQPLDGDPEYIDVVGDPLGFMSQPRFAVRTLEIRPGDRLYLYSDGLIEGYRDANGRSGRVAFGMGRLKIAIGEKREVPITAAAALTIEELLRETDGIVSDDILLMGIEF